jgi:hypothetical protein
MHRIQYHRYGEPEEMRLRHMNCLPSVNMFMIYAPFPRAIGTDFSGVLESIGSTEGASLSPCCVCIGRRKHRPRPTQTFLVSGPVIRLA